MTWLKRNWKTTLTGFVLLLALAAVCVFFPFPPEDLSALKDRAANYDVTVLRDTYSPTLGLDTDLSSRSLRMLELFGNDESITPEEFVQYKFDMQYSKASIVAQLVNMISNAQMPTPDTARAQQIIRDWDMRTDPDNVGAAIMAYTPNALNAKYPGSIKLSKLGEGTVNEAMLMDAFTEAVNTLMTRFGRVDMPWGDINRSCAAISISPSAADPISFTLRMAPCRKMAALRSPMATHMC